MVDEKGLRGKHETIRHTPEGSRIPIRPYPGDTAIPPGPGAPSSERVNERGSLADFAHEIESILGVKGEEEYGDTARPIFEALGTAAPGYAVAEKGLRYGKQGRSVDLVKAAAYAYLEWSRVQRRVDR